MSHHSTLPVDQTIPSHYSNSLIRFILISTLGVQFYTAHHSHAKSSLCGVDQFEPNNLRSRARNISVELKSERELSARVCQGDDDWYTVWLNRGDLVEFIVNSPLETPPEMNIYAPRKRKAGGIRHTVNPSTRKVRLYAKHSGRYRVHIRALKETVSRYSLSLHHSRP